MVDVVLFEGDGIGPEITKEVIRIIAATGVEINYHPYLLGSRAYDELGVLIPDEAIEAVKKYKVALKAPVTTPIGKGFRSVNVGLRLALDLYINLRPSRSLPNTLSRFDNIDLVIFRENTEDLYIGREKAIEGGFEATKLITEKASRRIIEACFEYARIHHRKRVTCVHKANILKQSDGLFLDLFREISLKYPEITVDDKIIDNMCMQMVMTPEKFDCIVTPNLYGDILSDLAAGLTGGLGLVPGANLSKEVGVFEAVHGSAPDIAGLGIANPIALLLSGCMMLDHLKFYDEANRIRNAVYKTLEAGKVLTRDLGGSSTTKEIADEIIKNL